MKSKKYKMKNYSRSLQACKAALMAVLFGLIGFSAVQAQCDFASADEGHAVEIVLEDFSWTNDPPLDPSIVLGACAVGGDGSLLGVGEFEFTVVVNGAAYVWDSTTGDCNPGSVTSTALFGGPIVVASGVLPPLDTCLPVTIIGWEDDCGGRTVFDASGSIFDLGCLINSDDGDSADSAGPSGGAQCLDVTADGSFALLNGALTMNYSVNCTALAAAGAGCDAGSLSVNDNLVCFGESLMLTIADEAGVVIPDVDGDGSGGYVISQLVGPAPNPMDVIAGLTPALGGSWIADVYQSGTLAAGAQAPGAITASGGTPGPLPFVIDNDGTIPAPVAPLTGTATNTPFYFVGTASSDPASITADACMSGVVGPVWFLEEIAATFDGIYECNNDDTDDGNSSAIVMLDALAGGLPGALPLAEGYTFSGTGIYDGVDDVNNIPIPFVGLQAAAAGDEISFTVVEDQPWSIEICDRAGCCAVVSGVFDQPDPEFTGLNSIYCVDDPPNTLYDQAIFEASNLGKETLVDDGTGHDIDSGAPIGEWFGNLGVIDQGNGTAVFDPFVAGPGQQLVGYCFYDEPQDDCLVCTDQTISVYPVFNPEFSMPTAMCITDPAIGVELLDIQDVLQMFDDLEPTFDPPHLDPLTGAFGGVWDETNGYILWSGPGVTDLNDGPGFTTTGNDHETATGDLSFTVISPAGLDPATLVGADGLLGTADDFSDPGPDGIAGTADDVQVIIEFINDDADNVWPGGATFDPAAAGPGTHLVQVEVGYPSCNTTYEFAITVYEDATAMAIGDGTFNYCASSSNIDLSTLMSSTTTPGGVFYLNGGDHFGSDLAISGPGAAPVGVHVITYAVGPDAGNAIFQIDAAGVATFEGFDTNGDGVYVGDSADPDYVEDAGDPTDNNIDADDSCNASVSFTIEICPSEMDVDFELTDRICEDLGGLGAEDWDDLPAYAVAANIGANLFQELVIDDASADFAGVDYVTWSADGGSLWNADGTEYTGTNIQVDGADPIDIVYFDAYDQSDAGEIIVCMTAHSLSNDAAVPGECDSCSTTVCNTINIISTFDPTLVPPAVTEFCAPQAGSGNFDIIDLAQYLGAVTSGSGYFVVEDPTGAAVNTGDYWSTEGAMPGDYTIIYTQPGSGECIRYDQFTITFNEGVEGCEFEFPDVICEDDGSGLVSGLGPDPVALSGNPDFFPPDGTCDACDPITLGDVDCNVATNDDSGNGSDTQVTVDATGYPQPLAATVSFNGIPDGAMILSVAISYEYGAQLDDPVVQGDHNGYDVNVGNAQVAVSGDSSDPLVADDNIFPCTEMRWDSDATTNPNGQALYDLLDLAGWLNDDGQFAVDCENIDFTFNLETTGAQTEINLEAEITYVPCSFILGTATGPAMPDFNEDPTNLESIDYDLGLVQELTGTYVQFDEATGIYSLITDGLGEYDQLALEFSVLSCNGCDFVDREYFTMLEEYSAELGPDLSLCEDSGPFNLTSTFLAVAPSPSFDITICSDLFPTETGVYVSDSNGNLATLVQPASTGVLAGYNPANEAVAGGSILDFQVAGGSTFFAPDAANTCHTFRAVDLDPSETYSLVWLDSFGDGQFGPNTAHTCDDAVGATFEPSISATDPNDSAFSVASDASTFDLIFGTNPAAAGDQSGCGEDGAINDLNPPLTFVLGSPAAAPTGAGATPTTPGGTFAGAGVVGNTFDPAIAGPGNHVITYSLFDTAAGACGTTEGSVTITVDEGVDADFTTNGTPAVCAGGTLAITPNDNNVGATTALWVAAGDLNAAPPATGFSISLTTDGFAFENGLRVTDSEGNEIFNAPQFLDLDAGIVYFNDLESSTENVITLPLPADGTEYTLELTDYFGDGILASDACGAGSNPAAGLVVTDLGTGEETVLDISGPFGMDAYTDIFGIEVASWAEGCDATDTACCASSPLVFSLGAPAAYSGPLVNDAKEFLSILGDPSTVINNGSVEFTVPTEWEGLYNICHSFANGACSETVCKDILVVPAFDATLAEGPFCASDESLMSNSTGWVYLPQFFVDGTTTTGGEWSGPGVTGDFFNPAGAGPGVHTITYTAEDNPANGCAIFLVSDDIQITVPDSPTITASASDVCDCGDVTLTINASDPGSLGGSSVTGSQDRSEVQTGITGAAFDPKPTSEDAPEGDPLVLTATATGIPAGATITNVTLLYEYSSTTGTAQGDHDGWSLVGPGGESLAGAADGADPDGDNHWGTETLIAYDAAAGVNLLTSTDLTVSGCDFSLSAVYTIASNSQYWDASLVMNVEYELDAADPTSGLQAYTAGGGLLANVLEFDGTNWTMNTCGLSQYGAITIVYGNADPCNGGCGSSASTTVNVVQAPVISGLPSLVCEDSAPFLPSANIGGGTWTITGPDGVTSDITADIDPSTLSAGEYTVAYSVGSTDCGSASASFIVSDGAGSDATVSVATVCQSADDSTIDLTQYLADGTNNGGNFTATMAPFLSEIECSNTTASTLVPGVASSIPLLNQDFIEFVGPAGANLNNTAIYFYDSNYEEDDTRLDGEGLINGEIYMIWTIEGDYIFPDAGNGYGAIAVDIDYDDVVLRDELANIIPVPTTSAGLNEYRALSDIHCTDAGIAVFPITGPIETTTIECETIDPVAGTCETISITHTDIPVGDMCQFVGYGHADLSPVPYDITVPDAYQGINNNTNGGIFQAAEGAAEGSVSVDVQEIDPPSGNNTLVITTDGWEIFNWGADTSDGSNELEAATMEYILDVLPNGDILQLHEIDPTMFANEEYSKLALGYSTGQGTACGPTDGSPLTLTVLMDINEEWDLPDNICEDSDPISLTSLILDEVQYIQPTCFSDFLEIDSTVSGPAVNTGPFISEFNYENYGFNGGGEGEESIDDHCFFQDVDFNFNGVLSPAETNVPFCEGVEISGPIGTDLSCYALVMYRNEDPVGGLMYDTWYIGEDGAAYYTDVAQNGYLGDDVTGGNVNPGEGTVDPMTGNQPTTPAGNVAYYMQLWGDIDDDTVISQNQANHANTVDGFGDIADYEQTNQCTTAYGDDKVGSRWFPVLDLHDDAAAIGLYNVCLDELGQNPDNITNGRIELVMYEGEFTNQVNPDFTLAGPFGGIAPEDDVTDVVPSSAWQDATSTGDLQTVQLFDDGWVIEQGAPSVPDQPGFSNSIGYWNCGLDNNYLLGQFTEISVTINPTDLPVGYTIADFEIWLDGTAGGAGDLDLWRWYVITDALDANNQPYVCGDWTTGDLVCCDAGDLYLLEESMPDNTFDAPQVGVFDPAVDHDETIMEWLTGEPTQEAPGTYTAYVANNYDWEATLHVRVDYTACFPIGNFYGHGGAGPETAINPDDVQLDEYGHLQDPFWQFNPNSNLSDESPVQITYVTTTTDGDIVCEEENTLLLPIVSSLTAAIADSHGPVCVTDPSIDLEQFYLPGSNTDGEFSGPGVSGNYFDPGVAGAGEHTIDYIVSGSGDCAQATSMVITVAPDYSSAALDQEDYTILTSCEAADLIQLTGDGGVVAMVGGFPMETSVTGSGSETVTTFNTSADNVRTIVASVPADACGENEVVSVTVDYGYTGGDFGDASSWELYDPSGAMVASGSNDNASGDTTIMAPTAAQAFGDWEFMVNSNSFPWTANLNVTVNYIQGSVSVSPSGAASGLVYEGGGVYSVDPTVLSQYGNVVLTYNVGCGACPGTDSAPLYILTGGDVPDWTTADDDYVVCIDELPLQIIPEAEGGMWMTDDANVTMMTETDSLGNETNTYWFDIDYDVFGDNEHQAYGVTQSFGLGCAKTHVINVYGIPPTPSVSGTGGAVCSGSATDAVSISSILSVNTFVVTDENGAAGTIYEVFENVYETAAVDFDPNNHITDDGDYTFLIWNKIGNCLSEPATLAVTVNTPPSLAYSFGCTNGTTGILNVTPEGGSGDGYMVSLDGGETYSGVGTAVFPVTAGENIDVVVMDGNGCVSTPVTVAAPLGVAANASVSCPSEDGSVTVVASPSNGDAPYSLIINGVAYTSDSGDFSETAMPVNGGVTVQAMDANNCLSPVASFDVSALNVSASAGCPDPATGDAEISVVLPGAGYTVTVTVGGSDTTLPDGATSMVAAGAAGQTVFVEVSDGACSATTSVDVAAIVSLGAVNPACDGASIEVGLPTGGTAPYSIWIDGVQMDYGTGSFSAATGAHTVQASDANGCVSAVVEVTVQDLDLTPILLKEQSVTSICSEDGQISFVVTSSMDMGATYNWYADAAGSQFLASGSSYALPTAVYGPNTVYVQVVAGEGCAGDITPITGFYYFDLAAADVNVDCNGEQALVSFQITGGAGASTYLVNGSSDGITGNFFSGLFDGGTTSVTITSDGSVCDAVTVSWDACVPLDPPLAQPDSTPAAAGETQVMGSLCVNDQGEFDPTQTVITSQPSCGSVATDGCNFIFYVEDCGPGSYTWTYEITGPGGTSESTHTVVVPGGADLNLVVEVTCDDSEEEPLPNVVILITGGVPPYTVTSVVGESVNFQNDDLIDNGNGGYIANYTVSNATQVQLQVTDGSGTVATSELVDAECTKVAIDLLTFQGEVEEEGNNLMWATAQEVDNAYFVLERSTDGVNFEDIAMIDGAIDSETPTSYDFMDKEAGAGTSYYRLSDITTDNVRTIASDVIALTRGEAGFTIMEVFPIPASDLINVAFASSLDAVVTIETYDVTGRLVASENVDAIAGMNEQTLEISNLPVGTYFLTINSGDSVATTKFVKE